MMAPGSTGNPMMPFPPGAGGSADPGIHVRAVQETATLRYFAYEHLPENLQRVSKPIGELAHAMEDIIPSGPEKSAGMRKLLEAKDCFVRAALPDRG